MLQHNNASYPLASQLPLIAHASYARALYIFTLLKMAHHGIWPDANLPPVQLYNWPFLYMHQNLVQRLVTVALGNRENTYKYSSNNVHVLMRDERRKEERSKQDQASKIKQARSNKQQGKATQHTQGSHFS